MAQNTLWTAWPDPDPNSPGEDARRLLLAEYNEHGSWARHFSGVRMTLGTFFLAASIGIVYQRWDKYDSRTALLAVITLLIGIATFLHFSLLTFKHVNRQRRVAENYQTKLNPALKTGDLPEPIPFWKQDFLYIVPIATAFFLVVLFQWSRVEQPKPPAPASQAVASRYTVAYSAVHRTSHGREAHTFLIDRTTGDLWQMRCVTGDTVKFVGVSRDGRSPAKLSIAGGSAQPAP